MGREDILISDVGSHKLWIARTFPAYEPNRVLISNGLATMGFALPAAIAAQLVYPERRVLCLTGDGGFMMVASELETVARLRLPLLIVVFNDEALSLIEVKQEQKGFEGVSMRYAGPDLRALARNHSADVLFLEVGFDAQALTPARTWVRYGGPDAAPVTTDGPLPETSDLVAGWYMIDVESHERAVELAAYVSSEPGPGGEPLYEWIDVREVMSEAPSED